MTTFQLSVSRDVNDGKLRGVLHKQWPLGLTTTRVEVTNSTLPFLHHFQIDWIESGEPQTEMTAPQEKE